MAFLYCDDEGPGGSAKGGKYPKVRCMRHQGHDGNHVHGSWEWENADDRPDGCPHSRCSRDPSSPPEVDWMYICDICGEHVEFRTVSPPVI